LKERTCLWAAGGAPLGLSMARSYDSSRNLENGSKLNSVQDAFNRVLTFNYNGEKIFSISDSDNRSLSYGNDNYDNAGRLIDLTHFNGAKTAYGYDNANRMTSLENRTSGNGVIAAYSFILDGNGNRTFTNQSEPLAPVLTTGNTTYTHNTQKNRLLSDGTNSFAYDNEGQLANGYGSSYIILPENWTGV